MAEQAASDTLSRKIKELRLAIQVENKMSKDQILAGYLNAAFFGTFYGNQAVGRRRRRRAVLRHHRGQADPARGGHAGRDGGEPGRR